MRMLVTARSSQECKASCLMSSVKKRNFIRCTMLRKISDIGQKDFQTHITFRYLLVVEIVKEQIECLSLKKRLRKIIALKVTHRRNTKNPRHYNLKARQIQSQKMTSKRMTSKRYMIKVPEEELIKLKKTWITQIFA